MCDTIRVDMKLNRILILALFVIAVSSAAAFAMGGPAPETPKENAGEVITQTSEGQTAASAETSEAVSPDIEKAKLEISSLEAQRESIDNYLEVLNKKIIKAKTAGDSKKLSELQAEERTVSEREKKVSQKILSIKEKYPELKPAGEAGVMTAEIVQNIEQPERMEAQKTTGHNIVYHDVVMGDTLMSISRKYFGTPVYYKDIARMNNISDFSGLAQGTSLKIDLSMGGGKVGTIQKTQTAQKIITKPSAGGIVYHVVAKGDTLMSISRKYFNGSSSYYKEIAEMNGITGTGLSIGMKLKIDTGIKKQAKPAL